MKAELISALQREFRANRLPTRASILFSIAGNLMQQFDMRPQWYEGVVPTADLAFCPFHFEEFGGDSGCLQCWEAELSNEEWRRTMSGEANYT